MTQSEDGRQQEPAGIPFGISEFPDPPVGLSAYMDYILTFFQNRLAQGKALP